MSIVALDTGKDVKRAVELMKPLGADGLHLSLPFTGVQEKVNLATLPIISVDLGIACYRDGTSNRRILSKTVARWFPQVAARVGIFSELTQDAFLILRELSDPIVIGRRWGDSRVVLGDNLGRFISQSSLLRYNGEFAVEADLQAVSRLEISRIGYTEVDPLDRPRVPSVGRTNTARPARTSPTNLLRRLVALNKVCLVFFTLDAFEEYEIKAFLDRRIRNESPLAEICRILRGASCPLVIRAGNSAPKDVFKIIAAIREILSATGPLFDQLLEEET